MYIVLCQMKRKVVAATGSYDIYTRYLRRLMERSTRGWREEVLHYATTTTKWRRYCLRPGTLSVSMVIKHDLFFFLILIYLFLNTMSALEINHVFTHDAFYYKWRKISAWIYITLGFTFISTLKVTRSLSLALLRHLWTFFVFVFFLVSCRIGYMKQPGRLSLAQSHICARGCRRVMPAGGRPAFAGITARLLQIHIETNR